MQMLGHTIKITFSVLLSSAIFCILCSCFLCSSNSASAEETERIACSRPDAVEDRGFFEKAEEYGLSVNFILTHDLVSNTHGGLERKTDILGHAELIASIDTEKVGLWDDGTLLVDPYWQYGAIPSRYVGDIQGTDNLESDHTFRLYNFWFEQKFLDDIFSVLIGKHEINSEFYFLDSSLPLINGSFGLGIDVAQTGPSTYPKTAWALRAAAYPSKNAYLLAAVYDHIPGLEGARHVSLHDGSNGYYIGEVGIQSSEDEGLYKLGLGTWYFHAEFANFEGKEHSSNNGFYIIAEKQIFSEDDPQQGLAVFSQNGWAAAEDNQTAHYYGTGLSYTGLIPSRDEDIFSAGMALARNGKPYRDAVQGSTKTEDAFEIVYHFKVSEMLELAPDFQYVVNPGTDSSVKDAVVLTLRATVAL